MSALFTAVAFTLIRYSLSFSTIGIGTSEILNSSAAAFLRLGSTVMARIIRYVEKFLDEEVKDWMPFLTKKLCLKAFDNILIQEKIQLYLINA